MQVYGILPAAGLGTRMASAAGPKQFLKLGGVPILVYALRAFVAAPRVAGLVVAVRAAERERVTTLVEEYGWGGKVRVIEGGEDRQHSVSRGLASLVGVAEAGDVVLVHDAVRPLIDTATIERTIDAVLAHGAAIVGLPAIDTIKQVERMAHGAVVSSTIPRERIVLAQTPQGARFELMQRAFAEAEADEFAGTDEASLLERAGIEVAVVQGAARNFKITHAGDLALAEFYLQQRA